MSGDLEFSRAKRYRYFAKPHKSQYDGNETQHAKANLTASVDGDYTIKADKTSFENPVVFKSTASLDGNVALGGNLTIGGNLAVTGSVIVTSSVLHKGDNVFGDAATDSHLFHGTTTASGDLNVHSNASLDGTLDVGGAAVLRGNASLDGTLIVAGDAQLNASLWAKGNASIDGALAVAGDAQLNASLWAKGNASIDGALVVGGNASLNASLSIGGNLLYDQFVTASILTASPVLSGGAGLGIRSANSGWMKVFDITNATSVWVPCWSMN